MTRLALTGLGVGLALLALAAILGVSHAELLRSGFAAWLVVIALPLGALPVLMALELAGVGDMDGTSALRLLLAALPLAALIGAVVLGALAFAPGALDIGALYGWRAAPLPGMAGHWFKPAWFGVRTLVYLAIWIVLALVFLNPVVRPSPARRRAAASGLALHLVIGTLAALDWTMSLDLGPNASAFGLLLITLQCAFATTAALLLTIATARVAPRELVLILLGVVAAAAFMQFVQYLVVWSANLPREIMWYQHRLAGLGSPVAVASPFILGLALLALMPVGVRAGLVGSATGLLLLLEVADLLWLVTPAWRGSFSISGLDVLALFGLAGVIAASALLIGRRTMREVRHG